MQEMTAEALCPEAPAAARRRVADAVYAFSGRFGTRGIVTVSAPGRTELAGNHTDHQNGCVLCAALTLDTLAVAAARDDCEVVLFSEGFGETRLSLRSLSPDPAERGTTAALIRGMAAGLAARGLRIGGFDAYVTSRVPVGGGFSSSASFEILLGAVFAALYGAELSPVETAQIARTAENLYFGKPSGLMDQCACALGGVSLIDFANPAVPRCETLPFDFRSFGLSLCAVSVGSSHADLTEDYAAIPREMSLVAAAFGKTVLREVDEAAYRAAYSALSSRLPVRALNRADHFFAENARVPLMAEALRRGDTKGYRAQMLLSGESSRVKLQNIVPASHPEERRLLDALQLSASLLGNEGAWRVHGGGFGGSILALMPLSRRSEFLAAMDARFGAGSAQELVIRPVGAIRLRNDS